MRPGRANLRCLSRVNGVCGGSLRSERVHVKKIPALVATALSAVLMTSVGVQTTSAAEVTVAADGSSGAASFDSSGDGRHGHRRRPFTKVGHATDRGARARAAAATTCRPAPTSTTRAAAGTPGCGSSARSCTRSRQHQEGLGHPDRALLLRPDPGGQGADRRQAARRAHPAAAERPPGHQGDEDAAGLPRHQRQEDATSSTSATRAAAPTAASGSCTRSSTRSARPAARSGRCSSGRTT